MKGRGAGLDFNLWLGPAPEMPYNDNFLTTIRSGGKPSDLYAEIEKGHYSSALCHLGNISYRLGKKTSFKGNPALLADSNEKVKESWATTCENMAAIGIEPSKLNYTAGPLLEFDATTEKFVNNPAADKPLTREYRKPFVVPESV